MIVAIVVWMAAKPAAELLSEPGGKRRSQDDR